jgi:hypothetical protein
MSVDFQRNTVIWEKIELFINFRCVNSKSCCDLLHDDFLLGYSTVPTMNATCSFEILAGFQRTFRRNVTIFRVEELATQDTSLKQVERNVGWLSSQSHIATDGQSVYLLLFDSYGLVFMGRPL